MLWVLNSKAWPVFQIEGRAQPSSLFILLRNDEIPVMDVLNDTDLSLIHNAKTFEDIAFLCIVTAIVAEHSYFLWKQNPSESSAPFKLAIEKFNLSADLAKIKTAIKEASHLETNDQKYAFVKIALENRLPL
ncbi:uncharacterized protein LACBIDRAFT_317562 [Laccaria bicolor S238N-H82]|uniref:Predicted protein n=1 Tax=Laccaria bicolor (strain S238N-H82 / ATCC MYA-4686) TaxID=486041 RepID=B0E1Y4_LACBS|nr:uncharacterized protein LACBIDRAFT_317562 [Laccaria bicolor S238N-H82]EDQ99136.1 predicted protein [Laccaria bicolor S238N-H82]|eukprot:XP_001890199.1 predicted protein [Laccaria bicolor S238N-H82]